MTLTTAPGSGRVKKENQELFLIPGTKNDWAQFSEFFFMTIILIIYAVSRFSILFFVYWTHGLNETNTSGHAVYSQLYVLSYNELLN